MRGAVLIEEPDRAGEICDYASTRLRFAAIWPERTPDEGPPLLAMHQKGRRVGVLRRVAFNDRRRRMYVVAEVSHDEEWAKVQSRFYMGLSIGGLYAARWRDEDTGLKRYTADILEISLVDRPCMPSARLRWAA